MFERVVGFRWLLVAAGVVLAIASAAEEKAQEKQVPLMPSAVLRFELPELPPTLHKMATKEDVPPRITVQLPANYSADRKFPLFVFLNGGSGGPGSNVGPALVATGSRDAIAVNIALFKQKWDPNGPVGGLLILPEDYETQSRAYQALLQKVLDAVPNTTRVGSTFGGFSNGAHTTGILLSRADPFLLKHFESFYMLEGGSRNLTVEVLQKPELRSHRFISIMGDRGRTARNGLPFERVAEEARAAGVDYLSVSMRGYGHEMPNDYLRLIGNWSRREPLPTPAPKPDPM